MHKFSSRSPDILLYHANDPALRKVCDMTKKDDAAPRFEMASGLGFHALPVYLIERQAFIRLWVACINAQYFDPAGNHSALNDVQVTKAAPWKNWKIISGHCWKDAFGGIVRARKCSISITTTMA